MKFENNSLLQRLEKDSNGILITISILGIIKTTDETWGYEIKQKLNEQFNFKVEIRNSTMYTILKSLEHKYGFLKSEMRDRRRYYSFTAFGKDQYNIIFNYFSQYLLHSTMILQNFGLSSELKINEVSK